ncbi:unnamed protein product [Adineta steineri]|uniref:Uncharacterized protein n=1 Tax=Adineta steineri TaxID=433720 RepID=A0A815TJ32_9BILA|nr:unnamed protein product [Adineta steineri]CAF1645395.1 unnamed protein product [Adineta steineri]
MLFQDGRNNNNNQTLIADKNNEYQTYQDFQQSPEQAQASAEEEVVMIPLEDVMHISYKCHFEKQIGGEAHADIDDQYFISENCCDRCCKNSNQVTAFTSNTIHTPDIPANRTVKYLTEELPIPESKENCRTRFCDTVCYDCRCWCCRKRKLIRRIKRTLRAADGYAERMITMTIVYNKYSNPDLASHTRLITDEHQAMYYTENVEPKIELKFNLLNDRDIDPTRFDMTKRYAETLCRVVTQLKGVRNNYPSDYELQMMLHQAQLGTFGEVYNEPTLQLSSGMTLPGTSDPQHQQLRYLRPNQRPYFSPRGAPAYRGFSPHSLILSPSPRPVFRTPAPCRPLMLMYRQP